MEIFPLSQNFWLETLETFCVRWNDFFTSRSKSAISLVDKKKNVHGEAMLAQEDDKMKNENLF